MQNRRANVSVERTTLVLNLGSEDEPNTVYLTFEEARSLAAEIESDLLAGEHGINVVDALLERDDASELLSIVEGQLGMDRLVGDSTHNWLKEGF